MDFGVNDFSADSLVGKIYSKYSTNQIDTNVTDSDSSSYLDFEGYLKLLTSQMSNQDFNNAMSDSEFIQQMASYSMMEAISQLTQQNAVTYASSLIGKAVTIQTSTGAPDTGIVESVTVTSEGCKVLVNGSLYTTDSISDVVDGNVYTQLRGFVGQTVEVKDGDDTVTGVVTGIIIKNGNGYVTLDNKFSYDMTAITRIITPDEDSDETENGEGNENADVQAADNTQEAQAEEYEAAAVNRGESTGTIYASEASYNALIKMLDDTSDDDTSPIDAQLRSATVNSRLGDMSRYMSANVNTQSASSGLSSDRLPAPYSGTTGTNNYYQSEAYQTNDTYYNANTQTNAAQSSNTSYDRGETSGVINVSDSNAESTSLNQYASETEYADMPVSTRKYADQYPVEAAFADSVGTHMTDIRFIGNTSVNSKIDTSSILCYSPSGRAVTDIGWCGKGRLGEVITFADGRQRVEIIGPTEVSYLYTSGKYTLDYICDYTIVDGSLQ
ncbi:MAG: flagellar hook assembly protein FlgD, partial [Huintestinicola sp.]